MDRTNPMLAALEQVNQASPFNRLARFTLTEAEPGRVKLRVEAGTELLNHAGALHAGVQSALVDTACGFAAGTVAGNVVTLQMNMLFLSSAKGEAFEARARVTKTGRTQIFADAELFALRGAEELIVASGTAVLAKIG